MVYVCAECGEAHALKKNAADCCYLNEEGPDAPRPPTLAELESAGQMRMLP